MNKSQIGLCCAIAISGLTCTNPSQSSSESVIMNSTTGFVEMNVSNGDGALAKAGITPELAGIENVWLTIKEVDVHTSGDSWITVAKPDERFDFLKLVNGLTVPLNLYPLPAGHYTQIRLILAEDGAIEGAPLSANEIVIKGKSYPIKIPSGTQSGIKCVHQFTVEPNQQTEICLQFDVLKAINYNNGNGYMMKPTYKTILCDGSQPDDDPR